MMAAVYEIRVREQLDNCWACRFEGFSITHDEDGTTVLTGLVLDQAALHGLLMKMRDLGLTLLSVNRVGAHQGLCERLPATSHRLEANESQPDPDQTGDPG